MTEWVPISLENINMGEYIKGSTNTNSQKHGHENNYSIKGYLIYKDDNYLHKCKILTREGDITNLCTWVGTSGYNDVFIKKI